MSGAQKTILVVDDDEDFREQMSLQLEAAGYNVVTADGEEAARRTLEDLNPDLAVIDLMMEHVDGGFTLAYRLKKRQPPVPVIMITAVASETGLDFASAAASESGWMRVDALLSKPVRPEQLRREIARLLPE
ncbi:MAG: response regulator [Acidobacteria bacterium]|jgi:CheY-like chemotaxis protein|nr:response regulator [Thermoanaerobaculia bacterium]MDI9630115.1 response regulator [Acidobacteriota bacterium]OQC41629.1 MAG: Alkaline phosphatase synthesis transcriptional regulatory protein PhoP [Acidobacteria bacterium ADurb.Bin051]MBP7814188.1 response regulator [Thermoanaerobaculia bacterium]MBP8845066.1 response regulator [Thermoanaerobaculia bacterium]